MILCQSLTHCVSMKKSFVNHILVVLASVIVTLNFIHAQPYVPTDKILLNCGATGETTDSSNRKWNSDKGSKYAPREENTITDRALFQASSVDQVPYMTARIFDSEFTYSFPVESGRKAVRLYFYPASYSGRNASEAVFDVTSGEFTLMSNFSALQTVQALNYEYMVKEYYVYVDDRLNITFKPFANASNSYAFVNGIEVVSMPDIYNTTAGNARIIGQSQPFIIDNSTNLETLYRLNIGGSDLLVNNDTGMFRTWSDDSRHIFAAQFGVTGSTNLTIKYDKGIPPYVAPTDIYASARTMGPDFRVNQNYNLTWFFEVDPGFYYLVRLHFCEIQAIITKPNQRMFKIFINNQTAEDQADAVLWTGGNGIGTYRDYVVLVPQGNDRQDLWLELHPNTESKSMYYDAILNGLEIFKVNTSRGNLAGPNPSPGKTQGRIDPASVPISTRSSNFKHMVVIAGCVLGALIAMLLLAFVVVQQCRKRIKSSAKDEHSGWTPLSMFGSSQSGKASKTNTTAQSYGSSLPSGLCRHFSFAEIELATNNFDDALILGVGGFGKVYKGEIDGGSTKVAIKRGNGLSGQGVDEFQTEIEMLSKLRHLHLVSLIGYCEENSEMILIYDYMAYGTLREHLYKTQKPPLPWKKRLEICIGAARGLHYLHTGAKHTIIHRDVKTTNILLDEKWVAKVSDFGLSKTGPALDNTHVSTVVKGSYGYLDPEYFRRHQLTEKSDVYSFGVVLFEVLCARPALNRSLTDQQVSLVEWALHCKKKGTLAQIMDPYLDGKIAPECFKEFTETAEKCVADNGTKRPTMSDVLWHLEFALQLQESAEEYGEYSEIKVKDTEDAPLHGKNEGNSDMLFEDSRSHRINMSFGSRSLASEDSDGLTPSAVFSQIMNPKGR